MRIPDGMEIIRNGTFYELIMSDDMVPIEKIIIPASVKEIKNLTFHCCNSLKEVKYEGNSSDLTLGEVPFYMCAGFHRDGSDIICKDRPKNEKKEASKTTLRLMRVQIIHKMVKSGTYPKAQELLEACNEALQDYCPEGKTKVTIYRDIKFMKDVFKAPIDYDTVCKGYYYYNNKFTLSLD